MYNDTIPNIAGCDSVVTLNLTINSNTGTDVLTACDSYVWIDGNTYTSSNNTATHTLTNAAGCDSVITLNLTLNTKSTNTITDTVCFSYQGLGGETWTVSGTYIDTINTTKGCDSITTYILTIGNSSTTDTVTNINNAGPGSLREIIKYACPNDTIRFAASLIAGGTSTILLESEISFSKSLTIIGLINGTDSLIISGGYTNRIFNIFYANNVTLNSLVLKNGRTIKNGGAINFIDCDTLFIKNSTISGHGSDRYGGGIFSLSSTTTSGPSAVVITNSTISNNSANYRGGGVSSYSYAESFVLVTNSTISNNTAGYNGGGIYSSSYLLV
jgi:hypothetical protein